MGAICAITRFLCEILRDQRRQPRKNRSVLSNLLYYKRDNRGLLLLIIGSFSERIWRFPKKVIWRHLIFWELSPRRISGHHSSCVARSWRMRLLFLIRESRIEDELICCARTLNVIQEGIVRIPQKIRIPEGFLANVRRSERITCRIPCRFRNDGV